MTTKTMSHITTKTTEADLIRRDDYSEPMPEGAAAYVLAVKNYLIPQATERKNGVSYFWTDGQFNYMYDFTRKEATRLTRAEALYEKECFMDLAEEMGWENMSARIVKL